MGVGDVYELVDVQDLYGQEVLNTYTYQQTAAVIPVSPTPNVAAVFASQWSDQILPTIAAMQVGDLVHNEIRVRNLFNDDDAYSLLISLPGSRSPASADTGPSFEAVGFAEEPSSGAVKQGAKRIAGIYGGISLDGVITNTTDLPLIDAVADILKLNVTAGTLIPLDSWSPIIVKRVRSGTSPNYEYRLPENSGELVFGFIIEVIFNLLVTTQVSRKVGRGA
jgi:hypothetical protein